MTPVIPATLTDQTAPQATSAAADEGAITAVSHRRGELEPDRPGIWLNVAAIGLCVLAGAAAAVSFTAQYRLVYEARRLAVVAGLEAAIPDAAALVFACLGVALARHGRQAVRARLLNVASAGASVFMNVIAAAPGWRDLAVWAMPPAAYALASDTLIGVVRTWAITRDQGPGGLAGEVTLVALTGGLVLWLLRLSMAPASTLAGFRAWVLEECPVAPGRLADRHEHSAPVEIAPRPPALAPRSTRKTGSRGGTKTARFLALVAEQHGPLAAIPLGSVGRISATVAPQAGLNGGAARTALRRAVLAAENGGQR